MQWFESLVNSSSGKTRNIDWCTDFPFESLVNSSSGKTVVAEKTESVRLRALLIQVVVKLLCSTFLWFFV